MFELRSAFYLRGVSEAALLDFSGFHALFLVSPCRRYVCGQRYSSLRLKCLIWSFLPLFESSFLSDLVFVASSTQILGCDLLVMSSVCLFLVRSGFLLVIESSCIFKLQLDSITM